MADFGLRLAGGGSGLRGGDGLRETAGATANVIQPALVGQVAFLPAPLVEQLDKAFSVGRVGSLATLYPLAVNVAPVVSAAPTLTALIDWDNDDDFGDALEDVTDRLISVTWTRGRSSDFSGEAQGAATLVLRNDDDRYTPNVSGDLTAAQLVPGRPVRIKATHLAVEYPQFFGYIERLTYDPKGHTCTITTYDPLRRFEETDVVIPANDLVQRSARDFRVAVLDDIERGTRNLISNPSFETDTLGWDTATYGAGSPTLTRITSDYAPAAGGAACAEYVAMSAGNRLLYRPQMAPIFFAGQVYRLSMYLRTVAGTQDWRIGLFTQIETPGFETAKVVTVTTTWQRFTLTFTMPATLRVDNTTQPFSLQLHALTPGTVRIDGVAITRGAALYPYADVGVGRWPNWIGNGSFDGGALNGWYGTWTNLVPNASFEAGTTGWSTSPDAFIGTGGNLSWSVDSKFGSHSAKFSASLGGAGAWIAIPGTFKAGVTYDFTAWIKDAVDGVTGVFFRLYLGSNGTPTDKAVTQGGGGLITNYTEIRGTWTPTSNHTDVHLAFTWQSLATDLEVDGFQVIARSASNSNSAMYSDIGPGGGGTDPSSVSLSPVAKYGSFSQSVTTPAAVSGRVYDFTLAGAYFVAGRPYTLSLWLCPSSSMPYKVGMGANKGDGTWDEASATGTAPPNVWTQVTATWTPSADRNSALRPLDLLAFVYQTDTTARTFLIDGARVIPGSSADDFELAWWVLGQEPDQFVPTAALSGSALSVLSAVNRIALSRHWTQPTAASPWYRYVVNGRADFAAKLSVESYSDDISDLTGADIDRTSIVNVVAVQSAAGTEYYSDEASVAAYGPRPGNAGSGFIADTAVRDAIGATVLAMRKDPRSRPTLIVDNRFPSQLQREVADVVTVTMNRRGIVAGRYNVQALRTTVDLAGRRWHSEYALEEHPF